VSKSSSLANQRSGPAARQKRSMRSISAVVSTTFTLSRPGGMRQNTARQRSRRKYVPVSRRRFLRTAVQGGVGASLATLAPLAWRGAPLHAQPAARGPALPSGFRLLSLGATNVLSVTTDDGIVLVDAAAPDQAAAL